jgi:hypothetical protein
VSREIVGLFAVVLAMRGAVAFCGDVGRGARVVGRRLRSAWCLFDRWVESTTYRFIKRWRAYALRRDRARQVRRDGLNGQLAEALNLLANAIADRDAQIAHLRSSPLEPTPQPSEPLASDTVRTADRPCVSRTFEFRRFS